MHCTIFTVHWWCDEDLFVSISAAWFEESFDIVFCKNNQWNILNCLIFIYLFIFKWCPSDCTLSLNVHNGFCLSMKSVYSEEFFTTACEGLDCTSLFRGVCALASDFNVSRSWFSLVLNLLIVLLEMGSDFLQGLSILM